MSTEMELEQTENVNTFEDKRQKHFERIRIGLENAVNHITQGALEKVQQAETSGLKETDIYSFQWTLDPAQTHDDAGNQTIFEGHVRLLDLMFKSKHNFLKSLNSVFNKDGETKYHCAYEKRRDKESGKFGWYIYVSWAELSERPVSRPPPTRGGRGRSDGRGRGGRDGRGFNRGGRGRGQSDRTQAL